MGTKKMKIAILFLTLIGLSFASATESTTRMCLDFEVNVYSSNSPAKVSFNIDMRKLKKALQILIQKTREAKDQLIVEEKKLTAVKNYIMKSNGQIAVLIKLKETLTINVQDITSKLVEKNDNLKILQEILRSQQEDLKNFKKTDVSIDLAYRKQQVAIMSYSKVPPEEFKKEHEIAVTKKMENVNTNYAKCNNQVENAIACNTATRAAMSLAKKLRKGFF